MYPEGFNIYLTNESLKDDRNLRRQWSDYSGKKVLIQNILGTHDSITGKYGTPISKTGMQSLASKIKSDI